MSGAPCKGCTERKLGCHDRCEKFQQYRQEHEKSMESLRKSQGIPLYPSRKKYLI